MVLKHHLTKPVVSVDSVQLMTLAACINRISQVQIDPCKTGFCHITVTQLDLRLYMFIQQPCRGVL